MDIRRLHVGEEKEAIELSDKVFRDNEQKSMGAAFPTLFSPEVIGHSYGCFIDGKLVSFMGLAPATIRVGQAKLLVYSLGSVCTDSDFGGRGIATRMLKVILEDLQETEASLLLVSGGRSLYTRAGCRTFGKVYCIQVREESLEGKADAIITREMTAADILSITQLSNERAVGFEQTAHDIAQLIQSEAYASCVKREHKVLVAEKDGEIISYLVLATPYLEGDTREALGIEWAGETEGIKYLISDSFKRYGTKLVKMHVPWQEMELIAALSTHETREEKNQGTVLVANPGKLLKQLGPYLDTAVNIESGGEGVTLTTSENAQHLSLDEFITFLFDPDVETGLKVPLPNTVGLNFI